MQSQFVGEKIGEKNPDYTIHLGDTYYSGSAEEMRSNFWSGQHGNGL